MACNTSANRSGLVFATLDHKSLPVLSNRLTDAARGNSERTSCAYGSMEFSKDINKGPSLKPGRRTLMQLAFWLVPGEESGDNANRALARYPLFPHPAPLTGKRS